MSDLDDEKSTCEYTVSTRQVTVGSYSKLVSFPFGHIQLSKAMENIYNSMDMMKYI